ncbi:hypothetical protein PENSUB_4606 [Penicillium subrubescens]|uniref:Uncharacterized protein n=1 Tax=Penicillium subrubescens TaxID=1316194 RepID=A0A1Q5UBX9_9EURO|nr:hypothetical protein PENSUB_4606 [Penicillium subrubescens]
MTLYFAVPISKKCFAMKFDPIDRDALHVPSVRQNEHNDYVCEKHGSAGFGIDCQFPALVRYNLLALQSLPEAERQDVAAKAGTLSLMPTMPGLDMPKNQVLLDSQVGENDDHTAATSWSEFSEFTHDLSISPIPSNS